MILHKSNYVEIYWEEENSLIIDKFLLMSIDMSPEEFKEEMIIFVEMCEKYMPEKELVHLLDMRFAIGVDEQTWMNEVIFPRYADIIKRMAFLVPRNFISELSVEQTMEEEIGSKFLQKYFDSEEKARDWLMK